MSPRPTPTRYDATAEHFLRTASHLVDAYLSNDPRALPGRLKGIRFPAALEWLRVEDVISLAGSEKRAGTSASAFWDRWSNKDAFLADALVYALLYKDKSSFHPQDPGPSLLLAMQNKESIARGIGHAIDTLFGELLKYPRSYLILHLAPLLPRHPKLWEAVLPDIELGLEEWAKGYELFINTYNIALRPGWEPQRMQLAMQCLLDGFLLRFRLQPQLYNGSRWENASILADTAIAFLYGLIDVERTGESAYEAFDRAVGANGI